MSNLFLRGAAVVAVVGVGAGAGAYVAVQKDGVLNKPTASPTASVSPSPAVTPATMLTPIFDGKATVTASPTGGVSAVVLPILLTDVKVRAYGNSGLAEVAGLVQNTDKLAHDVTLFSVLKAKDGSLVGTATGTVKDIAGSKRVAFSLVSQDQISDLTDMTCTIDVVSFK